MDTDFTWYRHRLDERTVALAGRVEGGDTWLMGLEIDGLPPHFDADASYKTEELAVAAAKQLAAQK